MKLKSLSITLACLFVVAGAPDAGAEEVLKKNATVSCGRGVSLDLPKLGPLLFGSESYQSGWRPMPANFFDYFTGGQPFWAEERPVHFVPEAGDKFFFSPCWSGSSVVPGGGSAVVIYEITNVEYDANRSHCRISYTGKIYDHGTEGQYWPMCDDHGAMGWNFPDATATPRLRTGGTEVSMPATSNELPQADSSNGGCASCAASALPFDRRPGNLSVAIGLGIDSKVAAQVAYEPNLTEVHQLSLSDLNIQNVLGDYQGNLLSGSVTVLDQLGLIQSTISVHTTPPVNPNTVHPGQNLQSIVLTVTPVGEAGRPVTTHTFERVSATGADFTGQGVRYTRTEGSQTQTMAFYNSGDGACGRAADGTLWGSFKTVDANGDVELWTAAPEDSAISWDATEGRWVGELMELHEFIPAAAGNPKVSTERRYARIGNQDAWNSLRVLIAETVTTTQGTSAPIVQTTRHGYYGNPVLADGMLNPYFGMKRWQVNADGTWELIVRGHVPDASTPDLLETVQVTPWLDGPTADFSSQANTETFFITLAGQITGANPQVVGCRITRTHDSQGSYAYPPLPWLKRDVSLANGVVLGAAYDINALYSGSLFKVSDYHYLYPRSRTERWNSAGTQGVWNATFDDMNSTSASLDQTGTATLTRKLPASNGLEDTDTCRVTTTEVPSSWGGLPNYQKGAMHPLWRTTTADRNGRVCSETSRFGNEGAPIQTITTTYTGETGSTRSAGGVTLSSQGDDVVANGQRTSTSTDAQGVTTTTVTDETTGEMISETRLGVTTNYAKTAANNGSTKQTVTQTAGGATRTLSVTVTDAQGRTVSNTDTNGGTTTYDYLGRTVTEHLPGGGLRITDTYLDGQLKSITGNAVTPEYHHYVVNAGDANYEAGSITETVYYGTDNGNAWRKTTTNFLGQTLREEIPAPPGIAGASVTVHTYNAKGQRVKTNSPGMADLIIGYDDFGRVSQQGYDMNADGALTVSSTDVLSTSSTDYVTGEGTVLERVVQQQYSKNNASDTLQTKTERKMLEGTLWLRTTQPDGTVLLQNDAITGTTRTVTTQQSVTGSQTQTQVYENGLLTKEVPPDTTSEVKYYYNDFGQLDHMIHPLNGTTTFTYAPLTGNLLTLGQSGADTATYVTNTRGLVDSVTHTDGTSTSYTYDEAGHTLTESGNGGYPLRYEYDSMGRLWKLHTYRSGTLGGISEGDVTTWNYDPASGVLLSKTDGASRSVGYTYDTAGRVHTRTWQRGISTSYGYDGAGRRTSIDYSDSTPDVGLTYDRAGRRATTTDAAGAHTLTYDDTPMGGGQPATWSVTGSGPWSGLSVVYGRNAGRRTSRATSLGGITLPSAGYTYTASGRLETVSSGGITATYRYSGSTGWNDGVDYTGGLRSTRTPDALGRLDSITWTMGGATLSGHDYTINARNRRSDALRQDGSAWHYDYNDRGEVTGAAKKDAANVYEPGKIFSFAFDGSGNRSSSSISSIFSSSSLRTTVYTPNALNQYDAITHPQPGWLVLRGRANTAAGTTVTIDGNAPTLTAGTLWFYEQSVDNTEGSVRREVEITATRPDGGVNNGPVTTQKKGALFIPPPNEVPTYDLDGNLTSDARWKYTWNAENLLIAVEEKPFIIEPPTSSSPVKRTKLEFAYDEQSRRIGKRKFIATGTGGFVLQQALIHLYDGWNMIAEINATSNAQLLQSYEWGLDLSGTVDGAGGVGGLLIERFHEASTLGVHAPLYDGNGNVTELINVANGSTSARYDYGAFGETISMDGGSQAEVSPFRFSTKYLDAETGMYNYGYRYYDAVNGRWLSRDPLGEVGGENLYHACKNNLVCYIDIFGLKTVTDDAKRTCCEEEIKIVELRIAPNGTTVGPRQAGSVGHAFIHTPNITWGFYPKYFKDNPVSGLWKWLTANGSTPGEIRDNKNYDIYEKDLTTAYRACPETITVLERQMRWHRHDNYQLGNMAGRNCAGWAAEQLTAAGLTPPKPYTTPWLTPRDLGAHHD